MKRWPNSFTGAKKRRRRSCGVTAAKNGPYSGSSSGRTGRTQHPRSVPQRRRSLPFLRVGPDGEARMAGRAAPRRFERRDQHAGVDGDDAALVGEHGVEIELAHLRQVGGQLRQLDQEQRDGVDRPRPGRCGKP